LEIYILPSNKILVIHVAKNPLTGVWSSILSLIKYQFNQPGIIPVIVVYPKPSWPAANMLQLKSLQLDSFIGSIGEYPLSYIKLCFRNKLEKWVHQLVEMYKPQKTVIHFHNSDFSGIFMPIPYKVESVAGAVTTYHGMPGIEDKFKYRRPWQKFLHRRLKKNKVQLVSTDKFGVDNAERVLGYEKQDFIIIPNGLYRKQTNVCSNDNEIHKFLFNIGFIGTIDWNKGWEFIVEAVNELIEQIPNIRLTIAGNGPEEGKLIQVVKGKPYIDFKGYIPNAGEVIIPKLDALVIPSKTEGLPMVLLESIAEGVPVLATPVGAMPEIIEDGKNGYIIERNTKSIKKAILNLIKSNENYNRMRLAAQKSFQTKYHIEITGAKYTQLYQKI
jgi:glycosyltransferase involved in cell wall biosynthesis